MPVLIAVVGGGVLGAVWSGGFGAVVGALLGWLFYRSSQQQRLITELRESLKDLQALRRAFAEQARAAALERPRPSGETAAPPASETAAAAAAAARSERPAAAPVMASEAIDAVPAELPPPAITRPADAAETDVQLRRALEPSRRQVPPPAPPPRDVLAPIKRWLFGGNTIVKAGVGILFIGLAFLAKFASEHVQLPVELRLAGIAAVALALLALGWRLRHQRSGYAQALQGGAIAVLYLTLFVAFRFYGVLGVLPVFVLMVLVAALAAALAVLQEAMALAVIGALGGFATPLLVSTGGSNHVALFSYYLVLDLGIAAVAWFRTWRLLNLIGFLATFIVATAWGVLRYQSENHASAQGFLAAYFVLFVAIMLMPARQRAPSDADRAGVWVHGALLFGLPTITFVLQYGLVRDTEYGVALSALVLAAFYVALAMALRARPRMRVAFEGSLAVGTVFLTLVIPFALDARGTAGAWALEGAGLVWLGFRQSRVPARIFGYALLALAGVAMATAYHRHGAPTAVLNAMFFNALLAAAAALAAALFVRRGTATTTQAATSSAPSAQERLAEPLLIGWGTLWLLAAAVVQIDAFVPSRWQLAAWLASFSVMALSFAGLALRFDWPDAGRMAMAHAPLHALGVTLLALQLARPMQDGGWWAWPLAALVHGLVLWRLAPGWPERARDLVHALGVLILATIGALQGRAITADWGDASSAWPWLGWLVAPALLAFLLLRPGLAQRWPIEAAPAAYQRLAAGVLTLALLLWSLIANVASNGSARPLPHLPLLNPLDLGVGVALLASWLWLRSAAAQSLLARHPAAPAGLIGAAGFVWLNAMLVRGFHHYGGVPFRVDAWVHSLAVQTGLTLLWSATALAVMWIAARRALRVPWLVGAGLLAAVVIKLLLVDLSGTGTVTRIVSFIGVGVLMLVIGYVAPLPSSREESRAAA